MRDEALVFGRAASLVGILTEPAAARGPNYPAVILLNAGIVHRVGPNRLYVRIARSLAAMGFLVLRFDFSGIGDSLARRDNLPFEKSAVSETQEAMDYLGANRGIERFVLMGICSGATISLKTACCDPRVAGAVLINLAMDQASAGEELTSYLEGRQQARYYWKTAPFNPRSWWKAISGKAAYRTILRSLWLQLTGKLAHRNSGNSKKLSPGSKAIAADLSRLTERGARVLLVNAEGDPGLDYLQHTVGDELRQLRSQGKLQMQIIPGADHIFTLVCDRNRLLDTIYSWVRGMVGS